jgi:hypothetical protein
MTYTGPGEPVASAPYASPGFDQPAGPVPSDGVDLAAPGPPPVPDPPRGPGVTPPFPVPPTEGRSSRVWMGLAVGALVAVLVCGGGIAAIIGLVTTGTRALNEQVDVVVGDYFEAVQQKRFDEAYGQLCEDAQQQESVADFSRRLAAEPAIAGYDIGHLSVTTAEPIVPVDVVYVDGAADTLRVSLSQDTSTGAFEVCGVER